jgi:hypothetical protein
MVSDELLEFWFFVLGVIVCIISVALFIYLIDRSRREGPFHFLGYAVMSAQAWQTGEAILSGEMGGIPTSPRAVQKLAREAIKQKRAAQTGLPAMKVMDKKQLDTTIAQLQAQKDMLDEETDQAIPES